MSQDLDITEAKNLIAHYTAEIEDLEFELGQSNKIIKEQQAEIEQLKEKYQNAHREGYEHGKLENQYEVAELAIENTELQKQVDEFRKDSKIYEAIYDFMKEKGIVSVDEMKTLINFSLKSSMLKEHIVKGTAKEVLQDIYNKSTCISYYGKQYRAIETVRFDGIVKSNGVEVK